MLLKIQKSLIFIFILLINILNANGAEFKVVKDMGGNEVKVPIKVEKVASLWNANNQIILALGAMDKVVAIEGNAKNKWFIKIYPRIEQIPSARNSKTSIQIEELLKINPDVILMSGNPQDDLLKLGFNVANVRFRDHKGMQQSISLTGEIIGGNAPEKAAKLNKYLIKNIDFVKGRTDSIANNKRPKVMHISDGKNLLRVDGTNTIVDEWIKIAGGVNAIQKEGFKMEFTMEEIINIDPDIITVGGANNKKSIEMIYSNPSFSSIKAVKNKKVFGSPKGVFTWDRYGAEASLQILWAAKTIQPNLFNDIDLKSETKQFYKNFMNNYDLSDNEYELILKGLDPEN